jgi:hypothetical protein
VNQYVFLSVASPMAVQFRPLEPVSQEIQCAVSAAVADFFTNRYWTSRWLLPARYVFDKYVQRSVPPKGNVTVVSSPAVFA